MRAHGQAWKAGVAIGQGGRGGPGGCAAGGGGQGLRPSCTVGLPLAQGAPVCAGQKGVGDVA